MLIYVIMILFFKTLLFLISDFFITWGTWSKTYPSSLKFPNKSLQLFFYILLNQEFSKSVQKVVLRSTCNSNTTRSPQPDKFSKMNNRSTGKLMSDCDAELASVLLTKKPNTMMGKTDKMKKDTIDQVRKRCLLYRFVGFYYSLIRKSKLGKPNSTQNWS